MNRDKQRQIFSIYIKVFTAIFALWGVVKCLFSNGFMGGSTLILYFTIQSNIWLAIVDILLAAIQLKHLKTGEYTLSTRLCKLQQVFTVSITLTGCVFCFVLLPAFMAQGFTGWFSAYEQMFLHVFTPILAIVDLLCYTKAEGIEKKHCFWATLPPFYYLGFAAIGYFCNWNFGMGNNYPYFFFNYGSPAGFFGFSDEMPYFMGSFYWILLLAAFVVGVSLLFISVMRRHAKKAD